MKSQKKEKKHTLETTYEIAFYLSELLNYLLCRTQALKKEIVYQSVKKKLLNI